MQTLFFAAGSASTWYISSIQPSAAVRKSYNMVRFRVTDVQGRSSSSKLVRIKSSFRFPRVFHCSYMLNFYCFRDIKNYWSKICIFSPFLCTTRKWCKVCCCLVLCNWRINRCFRIKNYLELSNYIYIRYIQSMQYTQASLCVLCIGLYVNWQKLTVLKMM